MKTKLGKKKQTCLGNNVYSSSHNPAHYNIHISISDPNTPLIGPKSTSVQMICFTLLKMTPNQGIQPNEVNSLANTAFL